MLILPKQTVTNDAFIQCIVHCTEKSGSVFSSEPAMATESTASTGTTRSTANKARLLVHHLCGVFKDNEEKFSFKYPLAEVYSIIKPLRGIHMTALKQLMTEKYNKRDDQKRAAFHITLGSAFDSNDPVWFMELRSQYMRQVFRLSISIELYRRRLQPIHEYFEIIFTRGSLSMSYILTGLFIQQKYYIGKDKKKNFPVKTATPFQILIFMHSLVYVARTIPSSKKAASIGDRIGFVVQKICRAWGHLSGLLHFDSILDLFMPYMLYDKDTEMFVPIATRDEEYAPKSQMLSLQHSGAVKDEDEIDPSAFVLDENKDKAYRHLVMFFFENLHRELKSNEIFDASKTAVWPSFKAFAVTGNRPAPVFHSLPEDICSILNLQHNENVITIGTSSDEEAVARSSTTSQVGDGGTASPTNNAESPRDDEDMNSSTITAPLRPRRQVPKRVRLTDVVKEEQEVVIVPPSEQPQLKKRRVDLSDGTMQTLWDKLFQSKYCFMFNESFENLSDNVFESGNGSLHERVQLILTDPPYNTRRRSGRLNSQHDWLSDEDMNKACYPFEHLLRPGGHGLIFCSMEQFGERSKKLTNYRKNQKAYDEQRNEASSSATPHNETLGSHLFRVDPCGTHVIRAKGHYLSNPALSNGNERNAVEHVLHFWRRWKKGDDIVQLPKMHQSPFLKLTHPPYVNVIDNVRLTKDEIIYKEVENQDSGPGRKKCFGQNRRVKRC